MASSRIFKGSARVTDEIEIGELSESKWLDGVVEAAEALGAVGSGASWKLLLVLCSSKRCNRPKMVLRTVLFLVL